MRFCPDSQRGELCALEYSNLHLWDYKSDTLTTPLASVRVGQEPLTNAAYNLHSGCTLIAVCGMDRSLVILDTRDTQHVATHVDKRDAIKYFQHKAHPSSQVQCVKWSPFVPFWVASGGGDHAVKLWDLRFASSPFMKLPAHYHSVNDVQFFLVPFLTFRFRGR